MTSPSITPPTATTPTRMPEVTAVDALATRLVTWLRRLPPPQERIDRLVAELDAQFTGRTESITGEACAEIERIAWRYSRHLLLDFDPAGTGIPDENDPGWPEPDPASILPRAAQVRQVSR